MKTTATGDPTKLSRSGRKEMFRVIIPRTPTYSITPQPAGRAILSHRVPCADLAREGGAS